jgi:RNA ligase (TIGR02306 family)
MNRQDIIDKKEGYIASIKEIADIRSIWNDIKDCQEEFEVSVKLDGTSCTYYLKDGVFGVYSQNLELVEDDNNTLWKVANENEIEKILRARGKNLALQGEVIGEGIQGNHEGIKGQQFYLFDIWDIDNQKYFTPRERYKFCQDTFCVIRKMYEVPILEGFFSDGIKLDKFKTIDDILDFANGESLNASTREGVVFKSMSSGLTFKVISNEYLLKQE